MVIDMKKKWDYAELSKAAKMAGGPEKYVEELVSKSKEVGKMAMLPWIGVAVVGTSLFTAATIKLVDYFKEKRAQDQQVIDTAKQEIIKGIKAYDEEQE